MGHYDSELQRQCDEGQQLLMATEYLRAERVLCDAAKKAEAAGDYDTLGRVYYPLQEARRQRRQVCGEGTIKLDLLPCGAHDVPDPATVAERYPHGQVLLAGWASVEPARELRRIADERGLYLETYLAAAYPTAEGVTMVALLPHAEEDLPDENVCVDGGLEALLEGLPSDSVVLRADDLPHGASPGSAETFAKTMELWENLSLPLLNAARALEKPKQRIAGYKKAIEADYACEKAHQWLATDALLVARDNRSASDDAGSDRSPVSPDAEATAP